jgi:hypothetical protein
MLKVTHDTRDLIVDDLPKLLGSGQARKLLGQLEELSTEELQTPEELRRAFLLLCMFAHAYVWGDGHPEDEICEGTCFSIPVHVGVEIVTAKQASRNLCGRSPRLLMYLQCSHTVP